LVKTLEQVKEFFGDVRLVSVSRELTKMHEETFNGTVADALVHFQKKEVKGEIVMVIHGKKE
jgi:16S rRNA (cytidine1402-2'-O)-methyltransferase